MQEQVGSHLWTYYVLDHHLRGHAGDAPPLPGTEDHARSGGAYRLSGQARQRRRPLRVFRQPHLWQARRPLRKEVGDRHPQLRRGVVPRVALLLPGQEVATHRRAECLHPAGHVAVHRPPRGAERLFGGQGRCRRHRQDRHVHWPLDRRWAPDCQGSDEPGGPKVLLPHLRRPGLLLRPLAPHPVPGDAAGGEAQAPRPERHAAAVLLSAVAARPPEEAPPHHWHADSSGGPQHAEHRALVPAARPRVGLEPHQQLHRPPGRELDPQRLGRRLADCQDGLAPLHHLLQCVQHRDVRRLCPPAPAWPDPFQ
mmetsp:Transcript_15593/g.49116  ORF Transcript_15593/g.49116 Transcript_15593/m.49116 type:complete len:310 (+) Transcript_15593:139-1068(+)